MRSSSLRIGALILPLVLCAAITTSFAQGAGQTQGTPGRPPTKGPERGLFGGKGATTKPGSHESSTKDEVDRIVGKFPAPKEKSGTDEERRAAAGTTAYVEAVALEGERQAVTLTRDDFRVLVDGVQRRVISIHYVFRGPQALEAGRRIAVGNGTIAHADEARTILVLMDENALPASEDRAAVAAATRVLDVVASVDRAAVLRLPQPGPLRFAAARSDLLAGVAHFAGRASAPGPSLVSFDALEMLLKDLAKMEGPKNLVIVEAVGSAAARHAAESADAEAARLAPILDAAAAARAVVHVVTGGPGGDDVRTDALHTLARSTGGTVTRLTGAPRDLAPLATALLGGYLLEIESRDLDRGKVHTLSITSPAHGVRVLAARRWLPRQQTLPPPVMKARP